MPLRSASDRDRVRQTPPPERPPHRAATSSAHAHVHSGSSPAADERWSASPGSHHPRHRAHREHARRRPAHVFPTAGIRVPLCIPAKNRTEYKNECGEPSAPKPVNDRESHDPSPADHPCAAEQSPRRTSAAQWTTAHASGSPETTRSPADRGPRRPPGVSNGRCLASSSSGPPCHRPRRHASLASEGLANALPPTPSGVD